jgi:hypothetical protein
MMSGAFPVAEQCAGELQCVLSASLQWLFAGTNDLVVWAG